MFARVLALLSLVTMDQEAPSTDVSRAIFVLTCNNNMLAITTCFRKKRFIGSSTIETATSNWPFYC